MTKLSLVVSTLGRAEELRVLLDSLAMQTFRDFELIVVDQNIDNRLVAILDESHWWFPVRRIHTPDQRGASRGRNVGWQQATGDYLVFPDDDCWFPADHFQKALMLFEKTGADIVSGRATDMEGNSINGRFEKEAVWVDKKTVWTTQIEWMIFFRKQVLVALEGFDDDIGVGASTPFQSCEAQDIVIRALNDNKKVYFDPALIGHHENIDQPAPDAKRIKKSRDYARGHGRVLRIHNYGFLNLMNWLLRPCVKAVLQFLSGHPKKSLELLNIVAGRAEGYFATLD